MLKGTAAALPRGPPDASDFGSLPRERDIDAASHVDGKQRRSADSVSSPYGCASSSASVTATHFIGGLPKGRMLMTVFEHGT